MQYISNINLEYFWHFAIIETIQWRIRYADKDVHKQANGLFVGVFF